MTGTCNSSRYTGEQPVLAIYDSPLQVALSPHSCHKEIRLLLLDTTLSLPLVYQVLLSDAKIKQNAYLRDIVTVFMAGDCQN